MNPIVAVIVGAWLGGETIGRRTLMAGALILVSVATITTMKAKAAVPRQEKAKA